MGIFSGVLLASDFDGTLSAGTLPSGRPDIPDRVRRAVSGFIAEGGRFTVSTGRTYQGFHAYDETLINAPVLLANGGMIYDYAAGRIVSFEGIGHEADDAFRAVRDRWPDVSLELYGFNETFCIHPHDKAHRHFTSQGIPYETVADPAQARAPWAKVMFGGEPGTIAGIQRFLAAEHREVGFVPTDGGYLEVLKPGMNKGTSLRILADALGLDWDDVYAAGDGYNDVDMLKIAAAAFVPENGDGPARACATYLVCSNVDGAIADAVGILRTIYAGRAR